MPSPDAAQSVGRRDRFGEPVDLDAPDGEHRCMDGWIDRDADRPVPCARCRPWLQLRRPPTRAEREQVQRAQPPDTGR